MWRSCQWWMASLMPPVGGRSHDPVGFLSVFCQPRPFVFVSPWAENVQKNKESPMNGCCITVMMNDFLNWSRWKFVAAPKADRWCFFSAEKLLICSMKLKKLLLYIQIVSFCRGKEKNENIASDMQAKECAPTQLWSWIFSSCVMLNCAKMWFHGYAAVRRKSSFQCTGNIASINSVHFARPVLCIIHVMHKELRTMTVRNDSERDVGMGFFNLLLGRAGNEVKTSRCAHCRSRWGTQAARRRDMKGWCVHPLVNLKSR